MIKCDCYHKEFGKERCYGTKKMEECSCGGDETRCDFYPTKCAIAFNKQKPMDILTLMRELCNKGYELKITPCSQYDNCVEIHLYDTNQSFHNIKIHMKVDKDYFKDPNGIIFETINKMIKDMDDYREA